MTCDFTAHVELDVTEKFKFMSFYVIMLRPNILLCTEIILTSHKRKTACDVLLVQSFHETFKEAVVLRVTRISDTWIL